MTERDGLVYLLHLVAQRFPNLSRQNQISYATECWKNIDAARKDRLMTQASKTWLFDPVIKKSEPKLARNGVKLGSECKPSKVVPLKMKVSGNGLGVSTMEREATSGRKRKFEDELDRHSLPHITEQLIDRSTSIPAETEFIKRHFSRDRITAANQRISQYKDTLRRIAKGEDH